MKSKYLDLKGQVSGTPGGIKITVFIPDSQLEKCRIYRESFNVQKEIVKVSKHEDAFHKVFVSDPTKE